MTAQDQMGDAIGTFVPEAANTNQQLLDCSGSSQTAAVSLLSIICTHLLKCCYNEVY